MKTSGNRAFVNQVLIYSLLAIGLSGSAGLGSVWMRHQISITANANKAYESRLAEVERRAEEIRTAIAQEQDVNLLLKRNADWRLGLVPPRADQMERVTADPVMRLAAKRDRDLFKGGVEPPRPSSGAGKAASSTFVRAPLVGVQSVSFRVALQH